MDMMHTYRFLRDHPLTRDHQLEAMIRFFRWQIASRLLNQPVAVPYVNDSRLFIRRGLHASTSTFYTGLKEFNDMGLVLHFLRSEDVFVDVGGNIGIFTILAAGGTNATTYAFEPSPETYGYLIDNINLNLGRGTIYPFQICIGAENGEIELEIDSRSSSRNHVRATIHDQQLSSNVIKVPVRTLDSAVNCPASCVKIDVEGYEASVIAGAQSTLESPSLRVVIIEMNPAAMNIYNHNPVKLHHHMLSNGFETYRYDPLNRHLNAMPGFSQIGNTVYLRDLDYIRDRLDSSPPFRILGQTI